MNALGTHLIIELYECEPSILDDLAGIEHHLLEAVRISGATVVKPVFHKFAPQGVSGVVVIEESHFSVHTWPEYGYCALDIFTCGELVKGEAGLDYLKQALKAKSMSVTEMKRGILNLAVEHHHESDN